MAKVSFGFYFSVTKYTNCLQEEIGLNISSMYLSKLIMAIYLAKYQPKVVMASVSQLFFRNSFLCQDWNQIYESNSNYVLLRIRSKVLIFCSKKHDMQFARQSFTHAWSIEVSIKNEWPLIESLLMYFMSCATFDFWCKNSVKAKS